MENVKDVTGDVQQRRHNSSSSM